MPIIKHIKEFATVEQSLLSIFPDQYVSQKKKEGDSWMKINMDYFYSVAVAQYSRNADTFAHNYAFLKGILRREDFYEKPEVTSFIDVLSQNVELPSYVQHYSILNPPLNTMVGEMSKRPDNSRVKAFDDDSKSEELQFKTDILNEYIMQKVNERIQQRMIQQGYDLNTEEAQQQYQQISEEQLGEYLTTYTSQAERWANRVLEALKMEFNMKELSEEGFRDLLVAARERYHIMEDNSKLGFKVESVNPKNTWYLSTPDKKYLKDAYASGIIEIMEMSEILNKYSLTKEEIDHLRKKSNQSQLLPYRESNLFSGDKGMDSIKYDTYNRGILDLRMQAESKLIKDSNPEFDEFLGLANNVTTFGNKYVVITAYWQSKKKIGKLTFVNEDNVEETLLVDENYTDGAHPQQLDLEWGWVNQWYKGLKIGDDIYYVEPLKILDYNPIIGVDFEKKNTEVKSLIDLMKPYQIIYNICMNQLYSLLQKEKGVVYQINIRKIPRPKDAELEDAIDIWEEEAINRGIVFYDDSPENMGAPTSNTNTSQAIDLTRTAEIQSRYTVAAQMKQEAWELVGINRQRMGGILATETATGTNAALQASYSQTEPWFVQHEYVMNQVYQAMLDAAQFIESSKPYSTISYISGEGESAFVEINGSDLKLRDLRVYVTSRAEDQRIFQELRQLAQPMLQNGADYNAIFTLFSTNSVRQMKDVTTRISKEAKAFQQRQMDIQEQQIQAQQQSVQMQIQAQQQKEAEDRLFEGQQKELDRLNKKEVAVINASSRNPEATADNNGNGIADALETTRLNSEINQVNQNYQLQVQKLQADGQMQMAKIQNDQAKLQTEKEEREADRKLKEKELQLKEKDIDTKLQIAVKNRNKFDK